MPKRYRRTYQQALDIVEADGWYQIDVRGSHHHFEYAIKKGKITLPDYGNSILPIDIVKNMYDVLYQEFKRVPCVPSALNIAVEGDAAPSLLYFYHKSKLKANSKFIMSTQSYPAIFHEDIDGVSVCVPDLPYVLTCGKDFDEAYKMAVDAIAGYIDLAREEGEEIPEPSDSSTFEEWKDGGYVVMVTADFDDYIEKVFKAPVGRLVVLTQSEVQNADYWGIDLSRLLKKALKEELDRQLEERKQRALELG